MMKNDRPCSWCGKYAEHFLPSGKRVCVNCLVEMESSFAKKKDPALKTPIQEIKTPRESAPPQVVYKERNRIVAVLAKLVHSLRFTGVFGAHIARHPDEDKNWDDDWRWIVFIRLPSPWAQLSWHIHDDELELFSFLPEGKNDWDHHTTAEKFKRMEAFCNDDRTLCDACSSCGTSFSAEESGCEDCVASRFVARMKP